MKKKFLYIPVETKVRELDATILLALEAIQNDYVVIFGLDTIFNFMKNLPEGIILHKDCLAIRETVFRMAKEQGFHVFIHDAEGLVVFNWDYFLSTRVDSQSIQYIDKYLCWGKSQYEALSGVTDRVTVVGHPRVDLLRLPICNYTQNPYRNYILVNTHFAVCNYLDGSEELIQINRKNNVIQNDEDLQKHFQLVDAKQRLMDEYIKLITSLSQNYHDIHIVVRPHPAENEESWKSITKDFDNVIVTKKESVGYWINHALTVIHTGCTTALEAFINDKVAISFKPVDMGEFEIELPDSISVQVKSVEDCFAVVAQIIDGSFQRSEYFRVGNTLLKDHIDLKNDKFSYQLMIESFDACDPKKSMFSWRVRNRLRLLFLTLKFKSFVKRGLKRLMMMATMNNKFEPTPVSEIQATLQAFQKSMNDTTDVKIEQLSHNIFMGYTK